MTPTTQQRFRVLHVDDDPDFADLTRTYLEREDDRFTVKTVTSADEGLQRISDRPPDCVVSDYNMPGMDGIEFLQAVREEFSDLPFILFTGKGSEEIASEAISKGVTDYLQKDTGTDHYAVLANRIRNAAERRAAERERNRHLEAIETAQEGISILDEDGHYIYVNQRFADIHGYDAEEMIGKQYTVAYPDEDIPEVQSEILPEVERTGYWRGETTSLRSDGGIVPVDHTLAMTDRGELVCTVRDISSRREREQELQRTERQYQAILEDPNILAAVTDTDGKLVEANQTALDYIDADRKSIIGEPFWNTPWWTDETRPDVRAKVTQAASGEYVEYEADLERPDGTPYSVEGVIRPVTDETDNVVSLVISARDVTRRKEGKQALQEVNQRFELLAEAVPNGLFLVAADYSELHYCNSAAEALYGVDFEELRDDPRLWRRHVHPDDVSRLENDIELQRTGCIDGTQRQKFRIQHPDEGTRWLEVEIYPVEEDGETNRLAGVATDITDRRERKQKLEMVETLFRHARECQFIVDVADGDFELRYANDHYERVAGASPGETVTGRTLTELFGETAGRAVLDRYRECVETGEPVTYTAELPVPEEGTVYRTVLVPVVTDGEVTHVVGTAQDITEQKHREEQLQRQNDRLEEFASVVSHDLRNPLRVANGRLELAREECESQSLDEVDRALDRMDALVGDLLTLAHEGEAVTDLEPVNLAAVAEGCWANVDTRDAMLVTDVDQTIYADESRLKQVFENLVRNAVEHGGEEVIVTVGDLDDGFYVEDDGPGIPGDGRDDVFDAGYTTTDEGTGFGLSIVEQVVDAHDWGICVTAGSEGGARFEITGISEA
ncbi:PAS domain S-box protein [Haloplanus sp.]|uniref:PAS domain S-box protein n=1 Tax=Haloplanus sp. TaxID=1961696 RepID=UPI0026147C46|nr:PAS domain S-box protein [Haloplanus sp.]